MTQVTIDTSPQAPLSMVQLLQVLNLATQYFGGRQAENYSWAPELTSLPTEISPVDITQDYSLTTSIFENKELNENGQNVLEAVKEGNLTLVRQFLEKGANLKVTDQSGLSALHWAVLGDHVEITSVLLNHSADPNVRTAMDNTPLHKAARIGNIPACRYLLEYRADVNAVNANGDMPLHIAARWGRIGVATLLLHHGADLTAPNNWDRTPAQEAASNRRNEMQRILEEEEARRIASSNNMRGRNEPQPKWYLITDTNTSQAIQYIPTVPQVPTTNTITVPTTPLISTVTSTVPTSQGSTTTMPHNTTRAKLKASSTEALK